MSRDDLYRERQAASGSFEFTEAVARVFPDMIERSVPGYRQLLELTPILVAGAVQAGSRIYDLGCSLGAATLAARRAVTAPGVEIIAVDNAPEMVQRCRRIIETDNSRVPVTVQEADLRELRIENASLVMLYFTLQFVPVDQRETLIRNIHAGLRPGGALLLAEKLAFENPEEQDWMDRHHQDFKRAQGYSDLEIARKRQALENVLIPETRAAHHRRLHEAGFGLVLDGFQALNFSCMVARK